MPPATTRLAGIAAVLALVALLSACSTRISLPDDTNLSSDIPADWDQRQRERLAFDRWTLMGKIAVRDAEHSESALVNRWRQNQQAYELQLSSAFLGMGSVRLLGDNDRLRIHTADGEHYQSDDPETLITRVTGWRLPLSVLPFWVRGVPAPEQPSSLGFGPEGQLRMLVQAGWQVHFERYSEPTATLPALPSLITATNGQARVRLAVSRWQGLSD